MYCNITWAVEWLSCVWVCHIMWFVWYAGWRWWWSSNNLRRRLSVSSLIKYARVSPSLTFRLWWEYAAIILIDTWCVMQHSYPRAIPLKIPIIMSLVVYCVQLYACNIIILSTISCKCNCQTTTDCKWLFFFFRWSKNSTFPVLLRTGL